MVQALQRMIGAFALLMLMSGAASACACCETWQVRNVASWDVLNIRSGPSPQSRKIGEIPANSACVIRTRKCRQNWCVVHFAEFTGWVNVRYLKWKP